MKNNMLAVICIALFLVSSNQVMAQFFTENKVDIGLQKSKSKAFRYEGEEGEQAFMIGLAPVSLVRGTGRVNVRGEFAYRHNKSISVLLGIPRKTDVPSWLTSVIQIDSVGGRVAETKYKNFALNIGHRFYFGGKKPGGGFYLEPYVRYNRFTMTFEQANDERTGSTIITGKIGGPGIGGALGVQWRIGKHFSVDWSLGLDIRSVGGSLKYESTDPNNDVVAFRDKVQDQLEDFPILGSRLASQIDQDFVRVRIPGSPFPGARSNLTLNFVF
jgi:Protein of unknown function (DUF3575)